MDRSYFKSRDMNPSVMSFNTNPTGDITKSFINYRGDHLVAGANVKNSNLTDKAASLHNIFFAFGIMVGTPLGGGLYDAFDWQTTCLVMACTSIAASTIYATLLCWLMARKKTGKNTTNC